MLTIQCLIFTVCSLANVFGQTMLGLNQGESCKTIGGKTWKCEVLKNCPQVGDFRTNRPTICSFQGIDPVICCPPATSQPITNSGLVTNGNAEKTCSSIQQRICGLRSSFSRKTKPDTHFVVGGQDAKSRVHKHMVLIGFGQADSKSWECGGSLVSERWVLSAAHCSSPRGPGPARWARVGDLDTSSTIEDARPQEKMIVQRITHPNYKEPAVYNDIALFKLDSDVTLNDWVAPICLHTQNQIPATKATVTGWGRLDFAGDVSPKLQEVDITLVNSTECARLYENSKDTYIPRGIDSNVMVCAGEKEGGKDACSGDSGGPLVIQLQNSCLKTQIGITSFGKGCGLPNAPGVYTRISYFVPWIESIVWPTT